MDRRELSTFSADDAVLHALQASLRLERGQDASAVAVPDLGRDAIALLDASERHHVVPVLAPWVEMLGLSRAQQHELEARATANARRADRAADQLVEIMDAFRGAAVKALVLKGLPLAVTTTGSVSGRHVGDIDLLIDPSSLSGADRVLDELGYRAHPEQGDPVHGRHHRAIRWIQKDRAYFRTGDLAVELHWRLSRYTLLTLGFDELWRGRREVTVRGGDVTTPGPAHNLLYLSAHAVDCSFYRLQWAVDVARCHGGADAHTMRSAVDLARRHRCGRSFALADQFARRLMPDLRQSVRVGCIRQFEVDRAETYCWRSVCDRPVPAWQTRLYRAFVSQGFAATLRYLASDAVPARITAADKPLALAVAVSLGQRASERVARARVRRRAGP